MSIYIKQIGERAQQAAAFLNTLSSEKKNACLLKAADALIQGSRKILAENAADLQAAQEKGMKESLVDRLKLTPERIEAMAEGIRQVTELSDPVGEALCRRYGPMV